jgi:hypothetical protein
MKHGLPTGKGSTARPASVRFTLPSGTGPKAAPRQGYLARRATCLSDIGAQLSINFVPGAVYSPPASIPLTLATAREVEFPCD